MRNRRFKLKERVFLRFLLSCLPFGLCFHKIELLYKVRSRIRHNDRHVFNKRLLVVYECIKQDFVVRIQNLIGRDEFSEEYEVSLSVRILLFFCKIARNEFLRFIIIEILIGCS